MNIHTKKWGFGAVAAVVCASTLVGATVATASPTVSLPKKFLHATLVSPAVVGYPPYAYLSSSNKIVGIDPDLSTALGVPLDHKVNLKVASFENSLLGLQNGTYFMVTGSDITAVREKTLDMVSYLADHYEFMSLASKPAIGKTVKSLCGLTISTVAADSSIPILQGYSSTCTKSGLKPINVTTFADQGSAVLAVASGQADATTATVTNLGYVNVQSHGKFQLDGPSFDYVYIGIATKKGNGLASSLAKAINVLIADGKYKAILAKYGVQADAVTKALVNPNPNITK
jgi:polar amino acid transport system substrate-binding protein